MRSYAPVPTPPRRPAKYGLPNGTRVQTPSGPGDVIDKALEGKTLVYRVVLDKPIRSTSKRWRPPVTEGWWPNADIQTLLKETP